MAYAAIIALLLWFAQAGSYLSLLRLLHQPTKIVVKEKTLKCMYILYLKRNIYLSYINL